MHVGRVWIQGIIGVDASLGKRLVPAGGLSLRERVPSRVSLERIRQTSCRVVQSEGARPRSVSRLVLKVGDRHCLIENAIAHANRLAPATGRVPGQPHTGLEVREFVVSVSMWHARIA